MADDRGAPAATGGPRQVDLDTSVAHPARVYDAAIGRKP